MQQIEGALNIGPRLGISEADAQILYALASVLLTLVLVGVTAWYASSTRAMVDEIRRQNRPYVFLLGELKLDQTPPYFLHVRNTGNRVALDICIVVEQDADIWTLDVKPGLTQEVRVLVSSLPLVKNGIQILAPNETRSLGFAPQRRIAGDPQRLRYRINYKDGAGLTYSECFSLDYWA